MSLKRFRFAVRNIHVVFVCPVPPVPSASCHPERRFLARRILRFSCLGDTVIYLQKKTKQALAQWKSQNHLYSNQAKKQDLRPAAIFRFQQVSRNSTHKDKGERRHPNRWRGPRKLQQAKQSNDQQRSPIAKIARALPGKKNDQCHRHKNYGRQGPKLEPGREYIAFGNGGPERLSGL